MFDPTAFDNMKVVLEGALYDRDLKGEILIVDRNDLINLAKLSRRIDVVFQLADDKSSNPVRAKFRLEAKLENMAAELLGSPNSGQLAGSHLMLSFFAVHKDETIYFEKINQLLHEIWGSSRRFSQSVHFNPMNRNGLLSNDIRIEFDRIIFEDQLDDLVQILDYMVATIRNLKEIIDTRE